MSPHKCDFYASFAEAVPDCEVVQIADRPLGEDRKALGWECSLPTTFETVISPTPKLIRDIARQSPRVSLHIFCGMRWVPSIVEGLKAVGQSGAKLALMSEPRVREGWRGELRYLQSWLTEGRLRRTAAFVLAIGRNGPPWFASVGYPRERIFPFAYFVNPPASPPSACIDDKGGRGSRIRIGYLGRFVDAKGVFDLVAAAAAIGPKCQLHFGGCGEDEERLRAYCKTLGVDANFHGVIPMSEVGGFLGRLDVLVLASNTKDGWGAVVSEALMSGTAAVATHTVGASLVLDDTRLGRMVPIGQPAAIAAAILEQASEAAYEPSARFLRASLARSALSSSAGAVYLREIIRWSDGHAPRPAGFDLGVAV